MSIYIKILIVQILFFAASMKLMGQDWNEKILKGDKNMQGASLGGLVIHDQDLSNTDFSDAKINGVKFINCNLKAAIFKNTLFSRGSFEYSDLSNTDFSKSIINRIDFIGCDMSNSIFMGVRFNSTSFKLKDLLNTDFSKAMISYVDYMDCNLSGSNFTDATLVDSNFDNVDIRNAVGIKPKNCKFIKSDITGTYLSKNKVDLIKKKGNSFTDNIE